MRIYDIVFNFVLANFRSLLLDLQIFLKPLEFLFINLVLFITHIFGQDYILTYFSPNFVQISIVEEPMLRK